MKIAIYYTHRESLGHSSRTLRIARHLKSLGNDVLMIQGGKKQEFLDFSEINVFNLPLPMYDKKYYHVRGCPVDFEKARRRAMETKKKLDNFRPDIFITEYFPLGRSEGKFELYPVIKWLKDKMPRTKIYSSVGYPVINTRNIKLLLKFSQLYDKIFIHTPKIEYEYLKKSLKEGGGYYKDFFDSPRDKVVFTGYIMDKNKRKKIYKLNDNEKKLIMISRGGGVAHPNIISKSILSLRELGEEFFMVACYGPASGNREIRLFNKLSRMFGNIRTFNFLPNFLDYLNTCDVSISMSGYNTSVEIMWLRKKSILIPYGVNEQISRANMMKDVMGSSVLDYDRLKPIDIASEIKNQLEKGSNFKTKVKKSWFNGLENLSRELFEI